MRIAYLILIHKGFELFKRMFKAIYHPDNIYLIHVDRKSSRGFWDEVVRFVAPYSNTGFMERDNCVWAGYSQVAVQLSGIRQLIESGGKWDFFINMSGQDFPLQTQEEIMSYLEGNKGKNFLHIIDQRKDWPRSLRRIKYMCFEIKTPFLSGILRTPIRRPYLKGVRPYAGSEWFILNCAFCKYLISNPGLKKFTDFYKYTSTPDESFFQTVIMNSEFRSSVIPDNKRVIVWEGGNNPRIFRITDLEFLLKRAQKVFFARKFDLSIDGEIVDELERYLSSRSNTTNSKLSK